MLFRLSTVILRIKLIFKGNESREDKITDFAVVTFQFLFLFEANVLLYTVALSLPNVAKGPCDELGVEILQLVALLVHCEDWQKHYGYYSK